MKTIVYSVLIQILVLNVIAVTLSHMEIAIRNVAFHVLVATLLNKCIVHLVSLNLTLEVENASQIYIVVIVIVVLLDMSYQILQLVFSVLLKMIFVNSVIP